MRIKERRLSQKEMSKALELASRYYEEYRASYSTIEIKESAEEVNIPEEFVEQAIEEVLKKKQQSYSQSFGRAFGIIIFCLFVSIVGVIAYTITIKEMPAIQKSEPKSQIYVDGTIRDLNLLRDAYLKSQDEEHKQAML